MGKQKAAQNIKISNRSSLSCTCITFLLSTRIHYASNENSWGFYKNMYCFHKIIWKRATNFFCERPVISVKLLYTLNTVSEWKQLYTISKWMSVAVFQQIFTKIGESYIGSACHSLPPSALSKSIPLYAWTSNINYLFLH